MESSPDTSYASALTSGMQNMGTFNSQPMTNASFPPLGNNIYPCPSFEPSSEFLAPPATGGARARSNSNKRRRGEDGTAVIVDEPQQQKTNASSVHPAKKKSVIGTSNSLITGRKMKSPPADIFVWGVHKDTRVDDIVKDLAECEIKIEAKDVQQTSKEDANLKSYKISIPAADLDPAIWPLRVKVVSTFTIVTIRIIRILLNHKRSLQKKHWRVNL